MKPLDGNTCGKIGKPKSKASKAPTSLHGMLAEFFRNWKEQTVYGKPEDWVFASTRKKESTVLLLWPRIFRRVA